MIIFLILTLFLLIILFIKLKIKIFFTLEKLTPDYKIEIFVCKLKVKTISKNELNKIINKLNLKRKIKKGSKMKVNKILKKIKVEELNVDLKIGLLYMFPTTLSIPIISTIIATILSIIKTEKHKIKYSVKPVYNNITLEARLNATIAFRIVDLIQFTSDKTVSP